MHYKHICGQLYHKTTKGVAEIADKDFLEEVAHHRGLFGASDILKVNGNALYGFTAVLAFPAIVVLIISAVFIMLQHPSHKHSISEDQHTITK